MECDYPEQRPLPGQIWEAGKIYGNRFCLKLCHSNRSAGRRGLQDYVCIAVHGREKSDLFRHPFFHDAHIQPFLVLADGCGSVFPAGHESPGTFERSNRVGYGFCDSLL